MRKEVLIADLQSVFGSEQLTSPRRKDRWQALPYSTDTIDGVIMHANRHMTVPDMVLDPKLCGYYDIYVGMYISPQFTPTNFHEALLKLSHDLSFSAVAPNASANGNHRIDEFRWRSVDMTGEKLIIRHPQNIPGYAADTSIAFFRFVPLTSEQFADRKAEFSDPSNKKLFATHDIHGFMFKYAPKTREDWLMIPNEFVDSDVESLSIEYIRIFDGKLKGSIDDYAFNRAQDRSVYEGLEKFILPEDNVYPSIIKRGHELGLKMYMSLRMGAWGIEFPMDGDYFDSVFPLQHPELRCYDRDGTHINGLSYAYPEVREYILDCFRNMLSYGCDGISLIYTRGTPYVLFEEPVRELFSREYPDIDCRMLPNTDTRLINIRSRIMTEFMRSVRALVDSYGQGKRINVHVHTSLKDNLYYALDISQWVREGLIDGIIVNNDYHWENLDGVMRDDDDTLIDLDKYRRWASSSPEIITCRNVYGHLIPKEAVEEYNALVSGTSVRVFCDLQRDTPEEAKEEALRLLDIGVRDICLWDTYAYKPNSMLWAFLSRLGHTDKLADFDIRKYTRVHRVNVINNMQVGRYCPWWGG